MATNTFVKPAYEDFMTEDDIAIYEQLIAIGRLQLGKELAYNESYLLHISAMITLKQKKGMMVDMDDDTIKELKRIHQEHQEAGLVFETPPDNWYASAEALKQPYLDPEVEKEINEMNGLTSNLVVEEDKAVKKTSNIEDEPADNDITAGYVKVVPRPAPEPEPEPEPESS